MRKTKFKLNDKTIAHVGRPEQSFYKGGSGLPMCYLVTYENTCGGLSCMPTQCIGTNCWSDLTDINGFTCESFWDDCDIPCVE